MRLIEVEDLVEGAVQEGTLLAVAVSPTGHLVVPNEFLFHLKFMISAMTLILI